MVQRRLGIHDVGRTTEAEATLKEVLERRRKVLGPTHAQTLDTVQQLAKLYAGSDRMDSARPLAVEELAARRAAAAGADASPADLNACAVALLTCPVEDLRDPKEALALARRANQLTNDRDPDVLRTLARALNDTGSREGDRTAPCDDRGKQVARALDCEGAGGYRGGRGR